jgi:hypothetical protein
MVDSTETWRLTPRSVDAQGDPAPLVNFEPEGNYAWPIAEAGEIRGFDSTRVELDLDDWLLRNPTTQISEFELQQRGATLWLVYGGFPDTRCDLNGDQVCDVQDIDALTRMIQQSEYESSYDLNDDGSLDQADRELWVVDEMRSSFGDANLDGRFDSSDFVQVFQAGLYESEVTGNATWGTGDWNGDGNFSTSDLVFAFQAGGYQANLDATHAVPEPGAGSICLVGVLALAAWRRGRHVTRVRRMHVVDNAPSWCENVPRSRSLGAAWWVTIVLIAATGVGAHARETRWRVTDSSGNWSDATNWTLGVPRVDDIAIISRNGIANVTDGNVVLDQLRVGHVSALDNPSNGTVRQAGGSLTPNNVSVSNDGVYELHQGTLSIASTLGIGINGVGTVQQFGGYVSAESARVGYTANAGNELPSGSGFYRMNDGTLSVTSLHVGDKTARGEFDQSGGDVQIGNVLDIFSWDTAQGPSVFKSTAGQLTATVIHVSGGGRLEQLGGAWDVRDINVLARDDEPPAEFLLESGVVRGISVGLGNSNRSGLSGSIVIRGGSLHAINPQPASPDDVGTFAVNTGTVLQSGGNVVADRLLLSTVLSNDSVRYDVTSGRIDAGEIRIGRTNNPFGANAVLSIQDAAVELSVGRLTIGSTLNLRDPQSASPGTLEFTQPPALFEITEAFNLGEAAMYRAAPDTRFVFRGDRLSIRGQTPAYLDGLQSTELVLNPTATDDPAWPQIDFEVAGRIDAVGSPMDNFSWGKLTVPAHVAVELHLVDQFDNQPSVNAPEALFVNELVLEAGAKLSLSGTSRLYYRSLTIDPAAELLDAANQLVPWNSFPGDFSGDAVLDVADLDLLIAALGTSDPLFDLNGDRVVNASDLRSWVRDIRRTWFGDANLDGRFDTDDLVQVFAAGEFEDSVGRNSRWSTGDFNGDGDFTTSDLVSAFQDGGYRRGPRTALSVPEPSQAALGWMLVWASLIAGRITRAESPS